MRVNPGGTTASATNDYTYTVDGQVESEKFAQLRANGTEILSSETVTTHYDKASMARWMGGGFSWGTYVAESRYTPLGKIEMLDLGNTYGTYVTRKYDHVTGPVTGLEVKRETHPVDVSLTYAYNNAGDITSIADRPAADAATKGETQCFTYDSLRRLTQAWTPESNTCSAATSRTFHTDATGTTVYLPGGQEMFFPVKAADPASATRYYSFAGETVAVRTGRGTVVRSRVT